MEDISRVRIEAVSTEDQDEKYAVHISPRERHIAELVAQGFSDKDIAAALGISRWTVASHLRRIFGKLHARTRAEMIARLIETGCLSLARRS